MKNLKDLKEEILASKINKFYVFYGEDYGLRHHYINEIRKHFDSISMVQDLVNFSKSQSQGGLFDEKYLYIAHGDIEFAKSKKGFIETFINKMGRDSIILVYEEGLENSTLFKEFGDYITYFPCVENNIAYQFVDSEISLSADSKKELARNCKNNYNNILLEADKIRNYAESKHISQQVAYDDLASKGQLLYEYPTFHSDQLMDDLLKGNFASLDYWYKLIKNNFLDEFWITLENIFNNYLIAYLVKKYGKYQGGNLAYDYRITLG